MLPSACTEGLSSWQRRVHVRDWLQNFVIDINQRDRFAGDGVGLGDHASQHIADIARGLADFDHQGPVLAYQADMAVAGDVRRRQNAQHAGMRLGGAGIHAAHDGARVIAELQCAHDQPLHADVIHITMLPQHQVLRVILGQARANAAIDLRQFDFFFVADGFGGAFNGVDDFLVARAAAEMRRQRLLDISAAGLGVAVDEVVGLHDDAGDAETALHAALAHESIGEDALPILAEPFGGGDGFARQLVHFGDASQQRLVIDLHDAAAAGGLRRAAIFGRYDAHVIAQPGQQRRVRVAIISDRPSIKVKVYHEQRLLSALASASQALFDRKP